MSTRRAFLGVAIALGAVGPVRASSVIGSTEPTQIMNNLELIKVALDGAITAKKTVEQYITQVQQFGIDKLNIAKLLGLPEGLVGDSLKALNDMRAFKDALSSLHGSLGQQASAIEKRVMEARLSGKDWKTYLEDVASDAGRYQQRAVERIKYEEQIIEQVQADYQFARNLQSKIPDTVGQHQSIQMLNTQMNRVITQNGKLLEVISRSTSRDQIEKDAGKAEALTRATTDQEIIKARQEAIQARQRSFGGLPNPPEPRKP